MLDRKLFTNDTSAKVFSLLAALLVWSTIKFAVLQGDLRDGRDLRQAVTAPGAARSFNNLPITVLTSIEDQRGFKVSPASVDVTVTGDPKVLTVLQPSDIHVFVNLRDVVEARGLRKAVRVYVPQGIRTVKVLPADVQVEQVPRTKSESPESQ